MTISISDLRFSWPGDAHPTLSVATFKIESGERVLLRGPSGCGKSTLLAALAGVIDVPPQTVSVASIDVGTLPQGKRDAFRVDHIGLIFQVFNLIPWLSVRDNVTLPCTFSTRRRGRVSGSAASEAEALLSSLGLSKHIASPASSLSHGQQQRVAAARALIGSPELILADEPTSALDPEAKEQFMALLTQEATRTGAALLVVSHDPGLESHFDRVVDMRDINSPEDVTC